MYFLFYASPNEIMPVKTGWPAIFSITEISQQIIENYYWK